MSIPSRPVVLHPDTAQFTDTSAHQRVRALELEVARLKQAQVDELEAHRRESADRAAELEAAMSTLREYKQAASSRSPDEVKHVFDEVNHLVSKAHNLSIDCSDGVCRVMRCVSDRLDDMPGICNQYVIDQDKIHKLETRLQAWRYGDADIDHLDHSEPLVQRVLRLSQRLRKQEEEFESIIQALVSETTPSL